MYECYKPEGASARLELATDSALEAATALHEYSPVSEEAKAAMTRVDADCPDTATPSLV